MRSIPPTSSSAMFLPVITGPKTVNPHKAWNENRIVGANPIWGQNTASAKTNTSGGLGFKDILDSINPLQQIPGVAQAYQGITGSAPISPIAKLAGGALFGGPIGVVVALASIAFEGATGTDPVSFAMNGFKGNAKPAATSHSDNFDDLLTELAADQNPTLASQT